MDSTVTIIDARTLPSFEDTSFVPHDNTSMDCLRVWSPSSSRGYHTTTYYSEAIKTFRCPREICNRVRLVQKGGRGKKKKATERLCDEAAAMDAGIFKKKLPMMADLVASFAIAEPPVKKVKREAVPDTTGSSDTDGGLNGCSSRSSSAAKLAPPPSQRRRRTAAVVAQLCTADSLQATKTFRKRTQVDAEEEFQTAWICGECNEAECQIRDDADQLLVCEGACRRLFHYPCAGLLKPPVEDQTKYVCQDCQMARHACAFCQGYGVDEQDVFPCTAKKCGLFFHEACLEMANIPVKLIQTHNSSERRREFTCPSHMCGTCCQDDMIAKEKQLDAAEARKSTRKGRKRPKASA
eukprot:scaffold37494_cov168-Amphora_coffeaeformis.AAC.1